MFRKKVDENREILLQSFYNLEDRLTEKLGADLVTVAFTASSENCLLYTSDAADEATIV